MFTEEEKADAAHTIREELRGVFVFVGVIWAVFILNWIIPIEFNSFGLVPRVLSGLVGIPLMPLLHRNPAHILGNTIPLVILLTLLAGSRTRTRETVAEIVVAGGAMLWIFGRSATHVGASGLIFGLVVFLILSGFLERRLVPLMVSVVVGFLYGGALILAVLPTAGPGVSWDGHLCGAIAGGASAFFTPKPSRNELAPPAE